MKKLTSLLVALLIALGAAQGALADAAPAEIRVASLKGPTTMGLTKLMQDAAAGAAQNAYSFAVSATADEIVPGIAKGEIDIAMVPANLASVLYKNTDKQVAVAAINTLGVLYVVEVGDTVASIADLKGKTLFTTGKGTTPEFALDYVLAKNGIDPAKDLTIEFKSEAAEVAAALAGGTATLAMLPQPYVAVAQAQNPALRVALSLTDEWAKADAESALITGVALVRRAFLDEHPDQVASFLAEYAASAEYVNANPAEAGQWIADLGIVPKAALAEQAIPLCNIVCITGDDMKQKLSGYLGALYAMSPAAVGGELPDDAFYYLP